ncbi:MAG: hypothetical protein DMG04_11260 [Acidobacteria bacterium]|nr:MAG: hypothetical protein DMG04_11260 [Acidobacteriota bacterium]PYQ83963.1 MAG: hypothetical protein DMG02_32670 [Acidobacteriota bacterium]PYR07844.1 MAG: hypothetical protein DMF99_20985 [Acidobacteriota bacterium]
MVRRIASRNPADFVFGNYEVGQVRGPTFFNTIFDLQAHAFGGARLLELRVEAFNLFDRPDFLSSR